MAQQLADESEADARKLKYSEIIDIEDELLKRKEMIEIALTPVDNTWTIYNTGDDNIQVSYKQVGNSSIYTTRGVMTLNCNNGNIDDYYTYQECGYNDVYINDKGVNVTEIKITKLIDHDHQIVYNSNNSGFMFVAPRDFTYIRTRFKYKNYEFNQTKYNKIIGSLAYSVNDKHPFNVETKQGHVRAIIARSGYVLTSINNDNSNNDGKTFRVCYVLSLDPCGAIPQWAVNQMAPSKGMNVKKFVESWDDMMETMKIREKNNWKKDHKPLFERHPKLVFVDQNQNDNDKSNDNNNSNDNDDNAGNDNDEKTD